MPSPVDTFLQSSADFVNGLPDWSFAIFAIILVIGIPIGTVILCSGDDNNV